MKEQLSVVDLAIEIGIRLTLLASKLLSEMCASTLSLEAVETGSP